MNHYQRILAALSAVNNEDGMSSPTDLQLHTYQALIRRAEEDHEATVDLLIRVMHRSDETSRSQMRRYVRRLAIQAQRGALMAYYEDQVGYMGEIASTSDTEQINNYVRGMLDANELSPRFFDDENL